MFTQHVKKILISFVSLDELLSIVDIGSQLLDFLYLKLKTRIYYLLIRNLCGNVKSVQPLWKMVWRFLKKLKIELPYDPAIPLWGIYPKETKSLSWKDICTPVFTAVLFTIVKIVETT